MSLMVQSNATEEIVSRASHCHSDLHVRDPLFTCSHHSYCCKYYSSTGNLLATFCVSRTRRTMYCGHARMCVCVCVSVCLCVCLSAAVRPHYCTDPDVTWGTGRGCPLAVHYCADLQSVHRLRCYGNITRTLVYAGCARVAD